MKITMGNIVKHWKMLVFLTISIQTLALLLYKALGVENILGMKYHSLSALISSPAFFLYLHFKKEKSDTHGNNKSQNEQV